MLVADRECGECAVCCEVLSIDTRTLVKPAGLMCPHNHGKGCGIYSVRHDVCRQWHCGWRMTEALDDDWRPDRSGILVEIVADGVPEGFAPPGVKFSIVRSMDDVRWTPLVDIVMRGIALGQPLFLELPGPAGHLSARTFLNIPSMIEAAKTGDVDLVADLLERAALCLQNHRWEKISA